MKNTIWKSEIPRKEGWYWIQYQGKNSIIMCPAQIFWLDEKRYSVWSAKNDIFNYHTEDRSLRIGEKIKEPNNL